MDGLNPQGVRPQASSGGQEIARAAAGRIDPPQDWIPMGSYNKGAVLAIAGSALASALAVGASFAPSTFAAFTDTSSSIANSATAGTLNIDVVDNAGNVSSAARVVVTNASPSMATRAYSLSIKNTGSLDASLRVKAANLVASTHSLDDVLRVQVLNQLGVSIYSGPIAGIDFSSENLPAASTTIYTIKVTWPDLPEVDDDPYQGASLSFDLTADASGIAGQ